MSMEDSCNSDVINESVDGTDTSKSCVPNVEITDCSNTLEGDKASVITEILEDVKG